MNKPKWVEPTPQEQIQANTAQIEMVELFNDMAKRGFPVPTLIAGMGAGMADILTTIYGNQAVPAWFQAQADLTTALLAAAN